MARIKESVIENYFVKQVQIKLGGKAIKLTSSGHRGLPDRFVVLPQGKVFFAEIKAPGRKPTPLQVLTIQWLKDLKHQAVVIDTKAKVDACINWIQENWYE